MAGVSVFGKAASPSIASRVMASLSKNGNPSPSQPATVPVDGLARAYASLYAVASNASHLEQDLERRIELERIVEFADRSMTETASPTGSVGAPAPTPASAPPPAAPTPQAPLAAPAAAAPGAPGAGAVPNPGAGA